MPTPVPTAADATPTAVGTSIAVGPLSVTVGGADRFTQAVPCPHATDGGAMTNEPAGSVSPLAGQDPLPGAQLNGDAWMLTCQPSAGPPVESSTVKGCIVV
jgi:hypothetical protein